MEDFEKHTEEYDNVYQEVDRETPSNGEPFPVEEEVIITKIN